MKIKFERHHHNYPCPWANGNYGLVPNEIMVGFLMCDGIPGLLQKLRFLLEGKMDGDGELK